MEPGHPCPGADRLSGGDFQGRDALGPLGMPWLRLVRLEQKGFYGARASLPWSGSIERGGFPGQGCPGSVGDAVVAVGEVGAKGLLWSQGIPALERID
jgi:hypothetical protein